MPVQTVNKGLYGRLVDVSDIRRCLTGFITRDDGLRLDEPESVDNNLSLDRLDWVNDHGYRSCIQGFERLEIDMNKC